MLVELVDDADRVAAEVELAAEYAQLYPSRIQVTLKDLVDFDATYWSEACKVVGEQGLRQELELCELVESSDIGVDESTVDDAPELDAEAESILTL